MSENAEYKVIQGFGEEWSEFDQSEVSDVEMSKIFNAYFNIIDWSKIKPDAVCFDLGCGSGRWANLVSERVGKLHCIDPSEAALEVARKNCSRTGNCIFHLATVDNMPIDDESCDFGYSLGVLHHVPDTASGIASCVKKIKRGAPFLVYLYYAFDNRAWWFKILWKSTEAVRFLVSRSPYKLRYFITQLIALVVYLPLSRFSLLMEKLGIDVDSYPLSAYREKSLYIMRNDALDRFGTKLEQRFTRQEIEEMMIAAGLHNITFNKEAPYWCAVGYRK